MTAQQELYNRVAQETASIVIRRYSTSFGLASRLLEPSVRQHVENIYALVRLADEIVDGVAAAAALSAAETEQLLTELDEQTSSAMRSGYSSNLIVHAFALTAREVGFSTELTTPFFDSMRADLQKTTHTAASFEAYVYGSAEVVGLMCLQAFVHGHAFFDEEKDVLRNGARHLGAAFQKINFLRDLAADFTTLGRSYFPDVVVDSFSEENKLSIIADIENDLAIARSTIHLLPPGSRRGVILAQGLFEELTKRLRATPAYILAQTRIRVPHAIKLRLAASAVLRKPTREEEGL